MGNYKEEKNNILRALTTKRHKREAKERLESLLDQAIEHNSKYWCKQVFELSKNDDETYKSDLPYYAYMEDQPLNDKDLKKIKRAIRWSNFLSGINKKGRSHYTGRKNRKISKIKKTPLEAARGTECEKVTYDEYETFVDTLVKNTANDLKAYCEGKELYSILHHRSHLVPYGKTTYYDFNKEINDIINSKEEIPCLAKKIKEMTNHLELTNEDAKYLGKSREEIRTKEAIVELLIDMILKAKDFKGKTPWYYGRRGLWKTYRGQKDEASIRVFLRETMMTQVNIDKN